MSFEFAHIFKEELSVINFRRQKITSGHVDRSRKAASPPVTAATPAGHEHYLSPRGNAELKSDNGRATIDSNLVGLALSGGGIRSASFSLGVLQALDSLSSHNEPHVLDAIDYLSVVSGGGYIGTSLILGLMQPNYTFPFDSRLDEEETPETQHLRDFSNFLAPNGIIDYLISGALVLRGLLVNAIIVLPALLLLAVLTIATNPMAAGAKALTFAIILAAIASLLMFSSAVYTSVTYNHGSLNAREHLGKALAFLLMAVALLAFAEVQPFVLFRMIHAQQSAVHAGDIPNLASDTSEDLLGFNKILPALAAGLTPAALFLIAAAQKLTNLAKASLGEATWSAVAKKYGSKVALYAASVIVPLLLWILYIYLSYWGIRPVTPAGCGLATPDWLTTVTFCDKGWSIPFLQGLGPVEAAYFICAIVLSFICFFIGPNANSLHRLYRDRLSRAFLFNRALTASTSNEATLDTFKFSSLKPSVKGPDGKQTWGDECSYAPYLLTNTAINLEASRKLNKRGRNADTFIFSPLYIGSSATGYVETTSMENRVRDLSLATAMATSGAAASANMGSATIKFLTFSLSLLNIRLGYWLANPARLDRFKTWFARAFANVGTFYFAAETAGFLDENKLNVYLTDGGHIENLGIYELLRRRCKVIVAVDAEGDPDLTFPSLINLQVLARIDLGVRIDLPWQVIQTASQRVTSADLYGGKPAPGPSGPHVAVGIIRYSDTDSGVIIYVKSSLTGDENDYVLDYKRQNSTFPHETTIDQFFTEDQFEAYRALGFHAARGFFSGEDDFAKLQDPPPLWAGQVAEALSLLNVPKSMGQTVVDRLRGKHAIDGGSKAASIKT